MRSAARSRDWVMTDALTAFLSQLIGEASVRRFVFISPHLDDAVLSCGALIEALAASNETVVATVFSEASPAPWSRPARGFLKACGEPDALALYERRREEDIAALESMGARPLHLGFTDAIFRRRSPRRHSDSMAYPSPLHALRPGRALLLNATTHFRNRAVYPTYHLDIARGRVSKLDYPLRTQLVNRLVDLASSPRVVMFAPLGIGNHVDHLMVRDAASQVDGSNQRPAALVFYSDFPYSVTAPPNRRFVQSLGISPHLYTHRRREAALNIEKYGSQFRPLFPTGSVPLRPEVYWTSSPVIEQLH